MKYRTKLTFKIYWQHVSKYKLAGFLLLLSLFAGSATNVIIPYFYKKFFDILTSGATTLVIVEGLKTTLFNILFIFAIAWVNWRLATFLNSYFQTKIMADIANTCFAYIHKHSFAFFQNNFVGSLVKRVNRFYRSFEGIADIFLWEITPMVVDLILISFILGRRSHLLPAIIIIWAVIYCSINYFFAKYKLKYDVERSEQDTKVTGILADTITNNVNVKLLVGYNREKDYFGQETDRLRKMRKFAWDLGNVFEAIQALLMIGLEFGLFYTAVGLWQKGILTIGDFVLIQAYVLTIFNRLWNFGRVIRHYYELLAEAEEMTEILDTPHEITDNKNAKPLVVKKGKIEFEKVNFNYHKTRRIIDGLNLIVKLGERIALVGPSGAGKSTIIKLLLRQHDIASGKILIDGQRVSQVTQESLWKNISLVPQDPILFHRTLMDNIRYGKPDATDEEVMGAAKAAHCHEFISEFQDGYNTYVGERGVKLSGGERQRVAIARAILCNAPILILDEATSSLDSESEKLIQDALDKLMKGKTVIVIAHRLSTIMKMDRIIVIDQGKIMEAGTHSELIKKKQGLYARLWKVQVGGFLA